LFEKPQSHPLRMYWLLAGGAFALAAATVLSQLLGG
jgi:hypothetical protein